MRWLVAVLAGVIFFGPVDPGFAEIKPPLSSPFGRPVLPEPRKRPTAPSGAYTLLAPGPPLLRPPVPLPGPVPGTVLIPGHWQGNRWIPGRLELRKSPR